MIRKRQALMPAAALATLLVMGVVVQTSPTLAQSACLKKAEGGTRAMLKQAIACQQETAKATRALAEKATENTAAIATMAEDLAALKADLTAVRGDVRQLGSSMAAVELVMGKTIESLAQPPKRPDLSQVTQTLSKRFDALAARMEKLMAQSQTPPVSN